MCKSDRMFICSIFPFFHNRYENVYSVSKNLCEQLINVIVDLLNPFISSRKKRKMYEIEGKTGGGTD